MNTPDISKIEAALAKKGPDMSKVNAAVQRYAPKRIITVVKPEKPVGPPIDAALRKELKSHGRPCKGFNCGHFLNRDS